LDLKPYPPISHTINISYKVVIKHQGQVTELEVEDDEAILSKALTELELEYRGLSVPHDCKLGVCRTCLAKLISGAVDRSEGMLSDDVADKGYALLCASYPRSDCWVRTIPEEELLQLPAVPAPPAKSAEKKIRFFFFFPIAQAHRLTWL
ncbi:Ferulic acid decarboxylase 1, partial [Dionaea muscipula]